MARNFCIDHYRASKREKEVLVEDLVAFDLAPASTGSSPHRALEDRDRRSFLRRGLEALPDKLREAVVLRDLQGLSYQEMADRLRPARRGRSRAGSTAGARSSRACCCAPSRRNGGRSADGAHAARGGDVMQLEVDEKGDVRIVRVKEAKLTYPNLSAFFAEVRQLVEGGTRKLIIDLAAVTYIDSASIGCLDGHLPPAAGPRAAR